MDGDEKLAAHTADSEDDKEAQHIREKPADSLAPEGDGPGAARLIGSRIGSWRLDALLHSGGMGSVFRATRVEADFTQIGALKLVRVGFESEELLHRFSHERKLLAGVEHPQIARLLDGGTTDNGLPWLAMELVDGLPIDAYADRHRMPIAQRLDLFEQLVDAIAYLHQSLIIHRDIKAANVLVDNGGHVRVLDFGVAGLLNPDSPVDDSAAPEQLHAGAISTATDVYALGVILYRLLTGIAPYRIQATMTAAEIETLICHREPPLASVALANADDPEALARCRQSSARRLVRALSGDLDVILATALQKDPLRRYGSVAQMQDDIQRYRSGRPIAARPSSAAYRTEKFVRRHWRGLGLTAAVICALLVGLVAALWQADQARLQRDRAQAMNTFMQEVLAEADPYEAGVDKRVRDVLAEASALLDVRFAQQPLLETALRQTVGGIQVKLMDLEHGEANLNRALALAREHLPDGDEQQLRAEAHLAWALYEREAFDESIARYQSILSRFSSRLPQRFQHLVHNDLGVVLNRSGRYREAIEQLDQSLALVGEDSTQRAAVLINLGYAYGYLDELTLAQDHYVEAIGLLRALGPAGETAALAFALNNYGRVLSARQRDEEALEKYLESLDMRRRVFGVEADAVGTQHLNVGRLLLDLARPDEALPHLQAAVEVLSKSRDDQSFYMHVARGSRAWAVYLTATDSAVRDDSLRTLEHAASGLRAIQSVSTARFLRQFETWLTETRAE